MFKKSIFFILLTILIANSFSLFGMNQKNLSAEKFSQLYSDEISDVNCSIDRLQFLLTILNNIKVESGSEDQAFKESLTETINTKLSQAKLEQAQMEKAKNESLQESLKQVKKTQELSLKKDNIVSQKQENILQENKNDICKDPTKIVNNLLNYAKQNKLLISENKIKVGQIDNGIYQLKVNQQNDGATCGPRAIFNGLTLIRYFETLDTKILNNLTDKEPVKIFLQNIEKTTGHWPENLQSNELEKIVSSTNFKNIVTVIDAFESIEIRQLCGTMNYSYIEDKDPKRIMIDDKFEDITYGKSQTREIGYFHSFVINTGGHWICLFGIKTNNKEYNWFMMDSGNANYFPLALKYIKKFLD